MPGGVIYPTDDYWPLVREICTRHNVLLIADEIITGFGRTGRWFGMEHWNVKPDILTFAKGVTSGYLPLGGMMVNPAIKQAMDSVGPGDRWMHAYTYSAHPTCCAAALQNLDIIEQEHLCANSERMGNRLYTSLLAAFSSHPSVGDIRGGKGLLAAVGVSRRPGRQKEFQRGPQNRVANTIRNDEAWSGHPDASLRRRSSGTRGFRLISHRRSSSAKVKSIGSSAWPSNPSTPRSVRKKIWPTTWEIGADVTSAS